MSQTFISLSRAFAVGFYFLACGCSKTQSFILGSGVTARESLFLESQRPLKFTQIQMLPGTQHLQQLLRLKYQALRLESSKSWFQILSFLLDDRTYRTEAISTARTYPSVTLPRNPSTYQTRQMPGVSFALLMI